MLRKRSLTIKERRVRNKASIKLLHTFILKEEYNTIEDFYRTNYALLQIVLKITLMDLDNLRDVFYNRIPDDTYILFAYLVFFC